MLEMKLDFFTNPESLPFFIQFGSHTGEMYLHSHADFTELVIVLEGSAVNQTGNESFRVEKGDVLVMRKNSSHAYIEAEEFKICNIMFDCETLFESSGDIKECEGFHALFMVDPLTDDSFTSRFRLSKNNFSEIKKIVTAALKEYESNNPAKRTMLFAYFTQIAVSLSRYYEAEEAKRESLGIAAAAAYMEKNFNENINTETLLEISHYSLRHFIRLFTECYKMPPHKYLQEIRIKHACMLLSQSDMPITEIAISCGFNDSSFFTRVFRNRMGVTPSEYRKRC